MELCRLVYLLEGGMSLALGTIIIKLNKRKTKWKKEILK